MFLNREVAAWSACLHQEYILPSLELASTTPPSGIDTTILLWSLATGITLTTKEAKHQYKTQCKQLDNIKEKDAKKKNKAVKWHPTNQCLMLHMVCINSNSPTEEIRKSYLRIINSDSAGMADREL